MLAIILEILRILPTGDGMNYSIAPLAIVGIAAGVKALFGAGQAAAAGRKKKEPGYQIPTEVGEAVSMARGMAAEGMPAAQRVAAEQGIQQSALLGLTAAQTRKGGLGAAQNIQAGMDRSTLNLAAQDAAMRQQNQRFAYSALMAGASYKDKEFANKWQSWMNQEQRRRANVGAGMQNISGAISMFGGAAMQNIGSGAASRIGGAAGEAGAASRAARIG